MRSELFKRKTVGFIETGSHVGFGIELAIRSGFDEIYSIELTDHYYQFCVDKFSGNGRVNIIHGDSFYELEKLLNNHNKPFTYWLDGHYSGDDTGNGVKESPLLKELEVILSRGVDGELIYIDDMRIYREFDNELNIVSILNIINKYRPDSKIWSEPSPLDENDILCIEY